MKLFGFEITRQRALDNLQSINAYNWWNQGWGPIKESFTGAWQQNVTITSDKPTLLASSAVFACVTGISGDIAKLPISLIEKDKSGIWNEIESPSFSPVLRKPNHYQTRLKFIEQWIVSKLLYGNTYVLKQRDNRGIVIALYVLHPLCVEALVGEDGSIYYKLKRDYLSHVDDERAEVPVPASEIIHDSMTSLWHPLIGITPLFACAATATMQAKIQGNSTNFFANQSLPGGVVTIPGSPADDTALRIKNAFEANARGANFGRIAVLSDGMTFQPITMTAEHSQLIDQLNFTVEDVARAFHYPRFKLTGDLPAYDSVEALNIMYYTDCLQILIEEVESTLNAGLGLDESVRSVEFDVDNLWRMDTNAMFEALDKSSRTLTPNERRKRMNAGPLPGGDTIYLQEQDHSLQALAARDNGPDPFGTAKAEPAPQPATPPTTEPAPQRMRISEFSIIKARLAERWAN